jgi:hypothetical protein
MEQLGAFEVFKKSNPVQIAGYAANNSIHNETAFAWWLSFTTYEMDKIIAKIKHDAY